MDSNKEEAVRCIRMAEAALSSGDKRRALKFVRIAQRLDPDIPVEELLAACEGALAAEAASMRVRRDPSPVRAERSYTEENVKLIGEIRKQRDHYEILGLERSCSVEEIRKAYRRLSLKVHPDKNRAPGSEEAFKIVCRAFKCLSNEETRREYDQNGFVEDFESNPQSNNTRRRRRRRAARNDYYYEDLDPDEVFGSFFFGSDGNVYRARHTNATRGAPRQRRETGGQVGEFSFSSLLHFVPFLVMFLILYLPFSEPDYALQRNYTFQIPKVVEKYGVEYYVKSSDFDQKFPPASPARGNLEYNVVRDHKSLLARYCHVELQRRQWARNYPTPHCDKLRVFDVV